MGLLKKRRSTENSNFHLIRVIPAKAGIYVCQQLTGYLRGHDGGDEFSS